MIQSLFVSVVAFVCGFTSPPRVLVAAEPSDAGPGLPLMS